MRGLPVVVLGVVFLSAAACSTVAVTPPSRTFVIDSPGAPQVGHSDVQLDAAVVGQGLGPNLLDGNARVRHTIQPGVALEADGGVLHVTNAGEGGDRNGYTGRLGVLVHTAGRHAAIGAGVGGGLSPTAGAWGSADLHGVISGAHRYVRPLLGGSLGYSAPFGDTTFTVRESGHDQVTLQLPRNAFGELHVGLELGPPHAAFVLGASLLHFWLQEDSRIRPSNSSYFRDEGFVALGIGLRIAMP